eukprot:jgi/Chrzof1/5095/Cz15g11080.t1
MKTSATACQPYQSPHLHAWPKCTLACLQLAPCSGCSQPQYSKPADDCHPSQHRATCTTFRKLWRQLLHIQCLCTKQALIIQVQVGSSLLATSSINHFPMIQLSMRHSDIYSNTSQCHIYWKL